jgi:3-phenylpropionate/trans-cinnamate dioxygenase ferredoxin reductase subunit
LPHHRYLIVGGGMAADSAARAIRAVDGDGSIGLVSAEPDPPYDRPPLTKGLWKDTAPEAIWRGTAELGVDLLLDRRIIRVEADDRTVTDDRGTVHSWDKLLLATGGTPRLLPGAPPQVIHFRTWRDYQRLRAAIEGKRRVAVIGGGFIGSELAAALAMNGKEVALIFPDVGIAQRVFPETHATFLNGYYRERGVDVRARSTLHGVRRSGERMLLSVSGPDGGLETLRVDVVVVGIGTDPATGLAESAGVPVEDGILVDGTMRTEHPAIWAAGDTASVWSSVLGRRVRVEHEDQANTTGAHAGRAMAGEAAELDHLPFFYSDLFDLGYEAVGTVDPKLDVVEDWFEPQGKGVLYYTEGGRVRGLLMWNVFGQVERARALIRAGERRPPESWRGAISLSPNS